MPLPEGFDPWEHLQNTLRRVQNRLVRHEFRDLGDDWDPDIREPRGSLRVACELDDRDTATMTLLRLILFYIILRKAQDLHPAMYAVPSINFQQLVRFYPQITLFFSEDLANVEEEFEPVESRVSFRLVGESPQTLTPAEARNYANRIKALFASGKGFTWKRGRELWSYIDQERGYFFQLLAWNEAEARKVVEQVMDVRSHSPDWDRLTVSEKKKSYQTVPGFHHIYGKSRRKYRDRPIATVRFRYAELKIHGLPNDITLVDKTGFRRSPLVDAS